MAYSKKKTTAKADVEFANGIYIKRYENERGGFITLAIRDEDGEYKNYTFYPKKNQEDPDRYIDYYGIVNNYKKED